MSESQTETETESEKLRAFVKKMHDEGTAGFADGPSPWETWDDESGLQANKRVWEGKSKRIYPEKHPQQSLGDRVLSGLAMLSLATMVVGIAGVYFSDQQPRQVIATGVQPLPIDRTPPSTDSVVANLEQLPTPAAGDIASVTDRNESALPAAVTLSGPDAVVMASEAPASDSTMRAQVLPGTPAANPVTAGEDSPDDLATRPAPTAEPPAATADTANLAGDAGIDAATVSAAPQHIAADDTGAVPASAASDTGIEPVSPAMTLTTAPVTVTVTVTAGTAATTTAEARAATAADTTVAQTNEAAMAGPQAIVTTPETVTDTAAARTGLQPLPVPLAGPVAAPEPDTGAETGLAPEVVAPVETIAAATSTTETATEAADTVAGLEALPVTMAGPAVTAEAAPADSTAMPPPASNTVVAVAEPGTRTAATAPAEAVEQTAAVVKTGDWVVNLASYSRESTANRMLAEFRDKGVDAELVSVIINDKPMHRVRVAGFANSRAAKASIGSLEQQLGLEGIWISRK